MVTKLTSTKHLREFLIKQMEECAEGNLELGKAKALSNLSQQIYNTLNLELKVAIAKAKHGDELVNLEPLKFDG